MDPKISAIIDKLILESNVMIQAMTAFGEEAYMSFPVFGVTYIPTRIERTFEYVESAAVATLNAKQPYGKAEFGFELSFNELRSHWATLRAECEEKEIRLPSYFKKEMYNFLYRITDELTLEEE